MFYVAGTGHRPKDLGGYEAYLSKVRWRIQEYLIQYLRKLQEDEPLLVGISGMAEGFDQDLAWVFCYLRIPWVACVPCEGQERLWLWTSQFEYHCLLEKAGSIIVVSPGPYEIKKMFERDEYMVDHCDLLIQLWSGKPTGGTAHTCKYAASKRRAFHRIKPESFI